MRRILAALLLLLLVVARPTTAGPLFIGLGEIPGGENWSAANALSADGTAVVGESFARKGISGPEGTTVDSGYSAFRWTAASGMQDLTGGPPVFRGSFAHGVSADGKVAVGELQTVSDGGAAFRWTESSGLAVIPQPGGFRASLQALSDDGIAAAGHASSTAGGQQPIRWTEATGFQPLYDNGLAQGISGNGKVVVGFARPDDPFERHRAFRWVQDTGVEFVDTTPRATYATSYALDASFDGSIVIGYALVRNGSEIDEIPFRWTAEHGLIELAEHPDDLFRAHAISADGSTIVGGIRRASDGHSGSAWMWDAKHGIRYVADVLSDLGVDVAGWNLYSASDVSADGLTIAGVGKNPSGENEAWIVSLPRVSIDGDEDGIRDEIDNCPSVSNADQSNIDGDLLGSACDPFPDDPDNEQAQCTQDLSECSLDLFECEAEKTQCGAALASSVSQRAALEATNAELTADLAEANAAKDAAQQALAELGQELADLQARFDACQGSAPNLSCQADLSGDGVVNFKDLGLFKSVFFTQCEASP